MNKAASQKSFDHGAPFETLAGTIERVTFHNAETGFCMLKVQARGKRDLVPVIGHAPAIAAGEWITATGIWFTAPNASLPPSTPIAARHVRPYWFGCRVPTTCWWRTSALGKERRD